MIPKITSVRFFFTKGRLPKKYPSSVSEMTHSSAPPMQKAR